MSAVGTNRLKAGGQSMSALPGDCVAKLFSAPRRVRSIQDRAPNRNIDSKARVAGVEYFKFQFHRLPLATFATQSPRKRTNWCAAREPTRCARSEPDWPSSVSAPFEGERGVRAKLDVAMIRSPRSLRHDRFRIVVRKKRRHIELAGLQIISAAPAIHHAGLHGLAGLDVGVPRKADE